MWLGLFRAAASIAALRANLAWGESSMTKILAAVALFGTLLIGPPITGSCGGAVFAQVGCCKVCKKGKACGDSCIAAWKDCHKGKGCACNG